MHEMGITLAMVDVALERSSGRKVRRLRIAVGALTAVVPDSLRFCFDVCTRETDLEGAELEIDEISATARCQLCQNAFSIDRPYGRCSCGSVDLAIDGGKELDVIEMELC